MKSPSTTPSAASPAQAAPAVIVRGDETAAAPFPKKRDNVADALLALAEYEDSRRNLDMAKRVITTLSLHYPNHRWEAYIDLAHGNCNVRNLSLSGNWGMYLHPKDLVSEAMERVVVRMAGELLERYNVARTRAGAEQAADYMRKAGKEFRASCLRRAKRLLAGKGIDWSKVQPQAVVVASGAPEAAKANG